MIILKDEMYNEWVVWKVEGRGYFEMFKSKYKKDCKEFIKNKKRKGNKNVV